LLTFFLAIDLVFLGANLLKIAHGGWVPLLFAAGLIAIMSTWRKGRQVLFDKLRRDALSMDSFLARLGASAWSPVRVKGTAVFMTGTPEAVPHALLHNLKHNKVLHERVVLMTVKTEDEPRVADDQRLEVEALGHGFHRVLVRYGFKEEPNIPSVLSACAKRGLGFDLMETSFFLSRETVIPSVKPELSPWRERVFTTLSAIGLDATEFFKIPPNRVVELGTQVEV
jgi:KUP system potassium uptake protein